MPSALVMQRWGGMFLCAGDAGGVKVWAVGPAEVNVEQSGSCEYVAVLTAAGTYAIKATLDGQMLPCERPSLTQKLLLTVRAYLPIAHCLYCRALLVLFL